MDKTMAGASAAEQARAASEAATFLRARADRADKVADAWRKGSLGERRVAAVLAGMTEAGYSHLADRAVPGSDANIDHLLVGPSGVFVIDAKNWSGALAVNGRSLRQNGNRRDSHVEAARRSAVAVGEALDGALGGARVPVRPVLCFAGEASIGSRVALDRVHLVDHGDLAGFITSVPHTLDRAQTASVLARIEATFPARTGRVTPRTPAAPPAELVVFLHPWKKAGRNRLYAKAASGHEVGYLDLVTGTVHAATPEWEEVLVQVLPHYLTGDSPGMAAADLDSTSRGGIRQFLDSLRGRTRRRPERLIVACFHWRGHGKSRVYLRRLAPGGGRTELGWFDTETGRCQPSSPAATAVLAYCSERFAAIAG